MLYEKRGPKRDPNFHNHPSVLSGFRGSLLSQGCLGFSVRRRVERFPWPWGLGFLLLSRVFEGLLSLLRLYPAVLWGLELQLRV